MKLMILEFANSKSNIATKLQIMSKPIIEHLFYLTLDKNNSAVNHWKSEIYAFLNEIDKLKNNNKYPKQKFIYDNTYGFKQDCITDKRYMTKFLKDVCNKEHFIVKSPLSDVIENLDFVCSSYFKWLSGELSDCGYVTEEDVFSSIDKILKKLPNPEK